MFYKFANTLLFTSIFWGTIIFSNFLKAIIYGVYFSNNVTWTKCLRFTAYKNTKLVQGCNLEKLICLSPLTPPIFMPFLWFFTNEEHATDLKNENKK